MSDDADLAQDRDAIFAKANLHHSKRAVPDAVATGECLFCEAHLPPGVRWCGSECRDDWQKEQDR